MSTKCVLSTKLHHLGLSWIISSRKPIKYDIKENNHPDWLNKGPWYNTAKILGLNSFIKFLMTHLAALDYCFVNQKTQIFFTSEG